MNILNHKRSISPCEMIEKEFLITGFNYLKFLDAFPEFKDKKHFVVTNDMALRLSKYFGNSYLFWESLQKTYDMGKNNLIKNFIEYIENLSPKMMIFLCLLDQIIWIVFLWLFYGIVLRG